MEPLYVFEDNYGHKHYLIKEISRGGQGAVFRTTDRNIAVKIGLSSEQPILNDEHNNAFNKIRLLPFPKSLNLTLPRAVLKGAMGYVMDLLEDMDSFGKLFNLNRYEPIKNDWFSQITANYPENSGRFDMLARYAASGGARRRLELYVGYAAILTKLHCAGLVFCDVSSNNVFGSTDPEKRNVWLIDSDNVNYQEHTLRAKSTVYTSGYAAPEVLQFSDSSMYSDAYAFAVSIFKDLTLSHPFKGRRYDELCAAAEDFADDVDNLLYSGSEPWILDLEDDSNALEDTQIPYGIVFEEKTVDMLDRMFSKKGRTNPMSRPTLPEIAERVAQNADRIVKCHHCGMDGVYKGKCRWCGEQQRVLTLESFYETSSGGRRSLWSFAREIGEKASVPARLMEGFIPDNTDKKAFTFSQENDGLLLGEFDKRFSVYASENGSEYKKVPGAYRLNGDSFTLRFERSGEQTVIVEGRVVEK